VVTEHERAEARHEQLVLMTGSASAHEREKRCHA
jgi:hypothetical protein